VRGDFINTGVPHFVVVPRGWSRLDVGALGREIRHNRTFYPHGSNVNFARRVSRDTVEVRTYERGVEAETLACGTGAVAVAVCLAHKGVVKPPVKLATTGGDILRVRFREPSNPFSEAFLYGPAQVIYEGRVPAATLRAIARRVERP
jgi:diaminopimelate epimerase